MPVRYCDFVTITTGKFSEKFLRKAHTSLQILHYITFIYSHLPFGTQPRHNEGSPCIAT